jgi:predicted acylesterase/phospholipase RssA
LTGEYKDFFSWEMFNNQTMLSELLFASFSIPGYFEPAVVNGTVNFDGSAIWDIDVASVINKCLV